MYFVVIARDAKDEGALERRMTAREAHIADVNAGIESGQNIMGAAMLNENSDMCGSVMTVEFESREALDAWLKEEPYVKAGVWDDVEVIPCAIPPKFLGKA